jgi:hypothetical protein
VGSHTYWTGDPSIFVWFCQADTPFTLNEIDRWGLPATEFASPMPLSVRVIADPGTSCMRL